MEILARSSQHKYMAFHSSTPNSTTAGGIGFPAPFDHSRPPEERPRRLFAEVVPGRAAWLRVTDTTRSCDVAALNVQNHALKPSDREEIRR
eukprot:4196975-Pyramimonas_sp.AAC.1